MLVLRWPSRLRKRAFESLCCCTKKWNLLWASIRCTARGFCALNIPTSKSFGIRITLLVQLLYFGLTTRSSSLSIKASPLLEASICAMAVGMMKSTGKFLLDNWNELQNYVLFNRLTDLGSVGATQRPVGAFTKIQSSTTVGQQLPSTLLQLAKSANQVTLGTVTHSVLQPEYDGPV